MTEVSAVEADGRRVRREQNRAAVVDALLALYTEGNLAPLADDIAARAGLSPRSLFRYFDDIDDLARAAIARQHERVDAIAAMPIDTALPLPNRIGAFVEQRVRLFEAIGAIGLVTRLRAPFSELIDAELRVARAFLRRQVATVFATELGTTGSKVSSNTLAALDVLCSYEAYQLLRHDQSLSPTDAATVLRDGVHRLLGGAA